MIVVASTTNEPGSHQFRFVSAHWPIDESVHWARDITFAEDKSQVRTRTIPHILATQRISAIGIIRHTTDRTVNIAAATRQLPREPIVTLDLLGFPPTPTMRMTVPCPTRWWIPLSKYTLLS